MADDLRSHMEQVARDMSGIVLELRRRGLHVAADDVTHEHDRWVRTAAQVLRERDCGGREAAE